MYSAFIIFLSVVVIGFVESAYTVNEADEDGLPLCAELSDGILERNVTVMFNSVEGTATSLGKYEAICHGPVWF